MPDMQIKLIAINKPENINLIFGQTHFIKTVEDIFETIITIVPNAEFGIAFCEASGARKIRIEGTNAEMKQLAKENAQQIAAGHTFIIFLKNIFPINILNGIKNVPEVCSIFCATANPTQVVIAETTINNEKARGVLGVIDGFVPQGIENKDEIEWRKSFLRKIQYKL